MSLEVGPNSFWLNSPARWRRWRAPSRCSKPWRPTAFSYRGKPVDVRQVGRELSVRYVLQGSVRRITDSLRINAQLVEAANASQLWAERSQSRMNRECATDPWSSPRSFPRQSIPARNPG